jgi:hypothetical protein
MLVQPSKLEIHLRDSKKKMVRYLASVNFLVINGLVVFPVTTLSCRSSVAFQEEWYKLETK